MCACRYLLFAADPYETIAFKIPNREIERDMSESTRGHFYTNWDPDNHTFVLELTFKPKLPQQQSNESDGVINKKQSQNAVADDDDEHVTITDDPEPPSKRLHTA